MNLSAGTRLGPYEITAPIGAGGMGEPYRDPPVSVAGNGLLAYRDGTTVSTEFGWVDRFVFRSPPPGPRCTNT